jgi:hypothetical protein
MNEPVFVSELLANAGFLLGVNGYVQRNRNSHRGTDWIFGQW